MILIMKFRIPSKLQKLSVLLPEQKLPRFCSMSSSLDRTMVRNICDV